MVLDPSHVESDVSDTAETNEILPNEILTAAEEAKQRQAAAAHTPDPAEALSWATAGKIGVGIGIGSAALAAAYLFVNRSKKK